MTAAVSHMALLAGAGYFDANAVVFDGTNDYLSRGADLTGISDGKAGTLSLWIDLQGGDGAGQAIIHQNSADNNIGIRLSRNASNRFVMAGYNAANSQILSILSNTTTYTASGGWLHVLASWDLAAAAGHFYVNDADDIAASPTLTNDTLDYTRGAFMVGALTDGNNKTNAYLAEVFFHTSYIDLSVQSNRRKFISAAGKPVNLGANGSAPLGVQPLVYLKNAAASFQTNLGSGGNFTVTGTLTDAPTSPSD